MPRVAIPDLDKQMYNAFVGHPGFRLALMMQLLAATRLPCSASSQGRTRSKAAYLDIAWRVKHHHNLTTDWHCDSANLLTLSWQYIYYCLSALYASQRYNQRKDKAGYLSLL